MNSNYFNFVTDYKWHNLLCVFLIALFCSFLFIVNEFIGIAAVFFIAGSLLIFCHLEKAIIFLCILFPFSRLILFRIGLLDIRFLELMWIPICIFLFIQQGVFKHKILDLQFKKYDLFFLCFIIICLLGIFNPKDERIVLKESAVQIIVLRESVQLIYLYSLFVILRSIFSKSENASFFIKGAFWTIIVFCLFGFIKAILGAFPLSMISVDVLGGGIWFSKSLAHIQQIEMSGRSLMRLDSFFWGSVGTANILIIQYYLISALKIRYRGILKLAIVIFLILTGSRAGWLTFYILFLLNALIEKKYIVAKFAISICTIALVIYFFPPLRERAMELFFTSEVSNRSHFSMWTTALKMFKDNPLLGVGIGHFPLLIGSSEYLKTFEVYIGRSEAHNLLLTVMSENGALGLLFFGAFFWVLLRPMTKYFSKEHHIFKNVMLAFLGTLFMNMTMNAFMLESFWIMIALLVGAYEFVKGEQYNKGDN